eukprot:1445476-Prymnesium_polylepis.1
MEGIEAGIAVMARTNSHYDFKVRGKVYRISHADDRDGDGSSCLSNLHPFSCDPLTWTKTMGGTRPRGRGGKRSDPVERQGGCGGGGQGEGKGGQGQGKGGGKRGKGAD